MSRWSTPDDDDDAPKATKAKAVPRRSALKSSGAVAGGVLGLAVAGLGYRAWQTKAYTDFAAGEAFAPYRLWQEELAKPAVTARPPADPSAPVPQLVGDPRNIVAAAILASSPHNTQPWTFKIAGNLIDVLADRSRHLGVLDPRDREFTIGLGCAIENLVVGARGLGFSPLVNLLPEGPQGATVARLTIYDAAKERSPLVDALARRRTNRGPYLKGRAVDTKILDALERLATSPGARLVWLDAASDAGRRFSEATLKATQDFVADAELTAASDRWFRYSTADIERHRDGITLAASGISPFKARLALMVPKELIGDAHVQWIAMTRDMHLATAPRFGLIVVPSLDDRAALLEAGRLWQRLHLQATVMGLAMHPLNQTMEMADRDHALGRASAAGTALQSLSALSSNAVAFGFRMGFSNFQPNPSPRRALGSFLSA
ncbi:MAG: hypothetical protein SFV19_06775 [Rhodospirillaceae bacterium]|nr:hypothetical protein [Rhodospirillaceae bacterium]